jgi:peptidoglycan/xylan/chitin deacetylase (PgdA/CDA1 family)
LEALRKRRLKFLSLRELFDRIDNDRDIEAGTVVFTMDDGFRDQAEIGAEIFCRYDCPATVFLITGFLDELCWPWDDRVAWLLDGAPPKLWSLHAAGQDLAFDTRDALGRRASARAVRALCKQHDGETIEGIVAELSSLLGLEVPAAAPEAYRPMRWDDVRRLAPRGIDFGPHTVNHYILSRLDDTAAKFEIETAWRRLGEELDSPLDVYAWPTGRHGDFGERDESIARSIGMRGAVATNDNYALMGDRRYRLERFSLPPNRHDLLQYATWIERAKQVLRGSR